MQAACLALGSLALFLALGRRLDRIERIARGLAREAAAALAARSVVPPNPMPGPMREGYPCPKCRHPGAVREPIDTSSSAGRGVGHFWTCPACGPFVGRPEPGPRGPAFPESPVSRDAACPLCLRGRPRWDA